jgi:predicted ATP-dependent Lon-type protease
MDIAKVKIDEDVWGKTLVKVYNITLDDSYPTGGYAGSLGFDPEAFGLKSILGLQVLGLNAAGSGIVAVEFDYTNVKLMAFRSTDSAHTHDLKIIGGQAAAGTAALAWYATDILGKEVATNKTILGADSVTKGGVLASTAAAASLVQVADTTDLAAVSIRALILGR